MSAKPILLTFLLTLGTSAQTLPKFMGREVTIIKPEMEDDYFPKGPATVCVEGPPQRQCYTAPKDFGRDPEISVVQLDKGTPALFFSASSGGVSGVAIHFALLGPGTGSALQDFFFDDMSISNQSQHALWNEPSISTSQTFITADYVWGPDESHYSEHRYMVSAYVRKPSTMVDGLFYYLEDRYMTSRRYDYESADILASEKQEILARLRRVKAAAQSQH